jgi:DNA primase
LQREIAKLTEKRSQLMTNGIAEIQRTATNLTDINAKEQALTQQCDEAYFKDLNHFKTMYVVRELISSPDDVVRRVTTELISEKYVLSKVHTKYAKIETEQDKLNELVPRAIYEWKDAILENQMRDIRQKIKEAGNNAEELTALMSRQMELKQLKSEFAKFLGERIVAPRK